MGKLDGRTALVTGASRGIGEHSARALTAEGAKVALAARSTADLERIAGELEGAVVIEVDLSQPGAGVDLAARAVAALGGVDILVNNAGVGEQAGEEAGVMQINYIAPLETTKALLGQMAERGHGSVIHISSIAGQSGIADSPTYSASKAAIDSLTRTQATAFGRQGIRVNAVAPGLIITEMWAAGRKVINGCCATAWKVWRPRSRRATIIAEPAWNPVAHHYEATLHDEDGYVVMLNSPFQLEGS